MRACLRGVVGGQRAEGGGQRGLPAVRWGATVRTPFVFSFVSSLCQQLPWRFVIAIWNFIDVSRK